MSYDGIGRNVRNGLNFTERGYGIRGAVGVSDRGNTAASQLRAEDVDWDYIFGKLGVRWLHTGGIFAALSETSAETVIAAVKRRRNTAPSSPMTSTTVRRSGRVSAVRRRRSRSTAK